MSVWGLVEKEQCAEAVKSLQSVIIQARDDDSSFRMLEVHQKGIDGGKFGFKGGSEGQFLYQQINSGIYFKYMQDVGNVCSLMNRPPWNTQAEKHAAFISLNLVYLSRLYIHTWKVCHLRGCIHHQPMYHLHTRYWIEPTRTSHPSLHGKSECLHLKQGPS